MMMEVIGSRVFIPIPQRRLRTTAYMLYAISIPRCKQQAGLDAKARIHTTCQVAKLTA